MDIAEGNGAEGLVLWKIFEKKKVLTLREVALSDETSSTRASDDGLHPAEWRRGGISLFFAANRSFVIHYSRNK